MTNPDKPILSIKTWAEDDQPRYKLKHKGPSALSDSELLAILIGVGSQNETAVDLCRRILQSVDLSLDNLARLDLKRLMSFKGIGEAKAITITAALEIGRRRQLTNVSTKIGVRDSKSAFRALAPLLADKNHEEFWILLLSQSNVILDRSCISKGGVSGTLVDPRIVFRKAIDLLASGVILCHNHPSGQLKPSKKDLALTRKIKLAGDVLDVKVMDHLIIGSGSYFSFADEGLL